MAYLSYFLNQPFPVRQNASDGPYPKFPGINGPGLAFYRPNQAVERVYTTRAALNGLGGGLGADISLDSNLLIGGAIALALGFFLFGGRAVPKLRDRRRRRLRAKLKRLEA